MRILFFILLFPLWCWSDEIYRLTEEELDPSSEDVLIKRPEKFLRNESMIYDFNSNLGIKDQRRYTGTDRNRLSIAGHVNGNYEQLPDLLGAEATYLRRTERYDQIWWGMQFFRHNTFFDTITQEHSSGGPNSEASLRRKGDVRNSVTGLGLGISYRFKLLLDFLETDDVFENIDVFVNMIDLKESFVGRTYRGPGLTTSYGIHKRFSTSYFMGGKFSYNLASVTREAIGEESKSERSLTLGWLSLAFEMGFFY